MRIFTTFALLFVMLGAVTAQQFEGRELVKATLVADSNAVVAGKPFTVGLRLQQERGWHTYWQYAGDSGIATRIAWELPPGFKAGEIQWPLPKKITEDGGLEIYGYHDEVLLLVEITPPKKIEGTEVVLRATASWLVCEKICIPGKTKVQLTLPVANQSQPANEALFTKYRAALPRTGEPPFEAHWTSDGGNATLTLSGLETTSIEFFPLPAEGMVIEHPSLLSNKQVTIPVSTGSPTQLAGVVVLDRGATREAWVIPSASSRPSPTPPSSLLRFLLLGFLGGMLLNVMPCVLPVITLKIYGFMQQAGQSRIRVMQLGLAYCAGVFAWFLGLAALIVIFGLNWSFQFQNKGFVAAMFVLCLLFGLNLLGLFELMLPGRLNTRIAALTGKEGLGGAFVHGLFATLMGSACTAPLLGPAIGFALAQPPTIIFAIFATIAAGMALPYFLLTLNPGWMRFLPKPGMWMVRLKQVMGALMLATAIWFGSILLQQVNAKQIAFGPVLEQALATNQTVFVDFTAEWCINCKVNEKLVLNTDPVQEAFKRDNVIFLKADWTNGDPDITALLKKFGRAGVPAYVIYPAGNRATPIVLPELLTQKIVLDALAQAQNMR